MKITKRQLRRIIKEAIEDEAVTSEDEMSEDEIQEKFGMLLDAGHQKQAIELAKSLGIDPAELPWDRFGSKMKQKDLRVWVREMVGGGTTQDFDIAMQVIQSTEFNSWQTRAGLYREVLVAGAESGTLSDKAKVALMDVLVGAGEDLRSIPRRLFSGVPLGSRYPKASGWSFMK